MKYAFIDRDGTLIVEPEDYQVDRVEKVRLVPGVIAALHQFLAAGYKLIMVTNQDGLGTQSFPHPEFEAPHQHMLDIFASQGIEFADTLICPHFAEDGCGCRKPQVGLLHDYLAADFDRKNSFVVGDRDSDVMLAKNMGLRGFRFSSDWGWPELVDEVLHRGKRRAKKSRTTRETTITVEVNLDGKGMAKVGTGVGFFDHMLEQLAKHSGMDLWVQAHGDLHVDDHHLVEDVGILLGSTLAEALADKRGIGRYGFVLPMDEAQAKVALDLCGRAYFVWKGEFTRDKVGDLSTELITHFWRSLSDSLGATLHIEFEGDNSHHQAEAIFKGVARTLRQAIAREGHDLPSTKGVL